MLKKIIENIIPIALLLHVSSCSSFGVSKSEMDGACGIIDETLETDSANLKNIEGTIGGRESNINNLVTGINANNNISLLNYLKTDITAWGKNEFDVAVTECFMHNEEDKFSYKNGNLQSEKKEHTEAYLNEFNEIQNSFKNYKDILQKSYKGNTGHLACARLIAVDLDKSNKLSYRIKYLPYIFRSGYSSNRGKIRNSFSNEKFSNILFHSLRFIEDYGFQDTNFRLNAPEDSDTNSQHTDSERALLLCLTEKAPQKISYDVYINGQKETYLFNTDEKSYKLANFVHENTIDLCIQVRNQNAMCGNCQCFYAGRDKVDLNGRGGIFLERGEKNDLSEGSNFNILSILKRMEKRKNGEVKNNYGGSLFLATIANRSNTIAGTKHRIGNQDYSPKNIINGSINTDLTASDEYKNAKGTYYSRSENAAYINGSRI